MSSTQRLIVLRRYPAGVPEPEDFELTEAAVRRPGENEVLVRTHYLSMDPAPRMRMQAATKGLAPMPLGQVVSGRGVGIVTESRSPEFAAGDAVMGELGWQEYALLPAAQLRTVLVPGAPLQTALGLLGASGIAGWFLVHEAAKVRAGDTVVVAAAAGAVGNVAVQLALRAGARVVGLVGSETQARFVRATLCAHAALDHRSSSLDADLAASCPGGVNVFLDSVGGALHNSVMAHLADHARIVAFGYISAYNSAAAPAEYGRMYHLIHRRATLQGFLLGDHAGRFAEAAADLSARLAGGEIKNFDHCSEGLEQAPSAFAALFTGDPIGKQLVRVHRA